MVSEYATHSPASDDVGLRTSILGHEAPLAQLRIHLVTAKLAMTAVKTGTLGVGGATTVVINPNLTAMSIIVGQ